MKEEQMLAEDNDSSKVDNDDDGSLEDGEKHLMTNNSIARRATINTTTAKRSATGRVRAFGSVLSGEKEESLDSDFEIEGDDASDLDSEDEMELMNLTTGDDELKATNGTANQNLQRLETNADSDDDF